MNSLPKVSTKTMIIQLTVAILLCCSLTFYTWQQNINQQLNKAQMALLAHQRQLQSIEEQQKKYESFSKQYVSIINTKWKQMAFQWDDITFYELQHRLDTLYSDCNILLPETLEIKQKQYDSNTQHTTTKNDSPKGYSIKLKLTGQWLCEMKSDSIE